MGATESGPTDVLSDASSVSAAEVARLVLVQGISATRAAAGMVLAVEGDALVLLRADGYPEGVEAAFARIPLDAPLPAAEAAREKRAIFLESPEAFERGWPELAQLAVRTDAFACLPLVARGAALGTLVLGFSRPRAFTDADRSLLSALANLGAIALERALLSERERLAAQRAALLAKASHVLAATRDYEAALDEIAALLVPILADWCVIELVDRGPRAHIVAVAHRDPGARALAREIRERWPPDPEAPTGLPYVLRTGRAQLFAPITDEMIAATARDPEHLRVLRAIEMRSAILAPARARGSTLGVITLVSSAREYGQADVELAEEIGRRVGLAIENQRLLRRAEAQARRERALAELGNRAIATSTEDALRAAVGLVARELEVELAAVLELREREEDLVLREAMGFPEAALGRASMPASAPGRTLDLDANRAAVLEGDAMPELLREQGVRSAINVLIPGIERPFGLLGAYAREPRDFTPSDVQMLSTVANILASAIARERWEAELEASRARLSGILESAMDAIITIDERQRILLFNAAAERMFGYEAASMIGKPLSMLVPERLRAGSPFASAVHAAGTFGTTVMRSDGTEIPVEATVSQMRDRGQVLATVILRDVTERVQVERERAAHQRALEDAARHKDDFLAMLGHELRNPLAAITNALQLQRMIDASEPELSERTQAIMERQVSHMVRLIDDLLDVSRIERGMVELRVEPLELAEVVRTVVADHQASAERRRVALEVELPPEPAWVSGDRARMVQVAGNLITNALKFTEPGGRITVRLRTEGREHVLEVADTGVGMDASVLAHVFEPFRQADTSLARTAGGLGLGLSVVRGLVELHGGNVAAESRGPGTGSTFRVRLPAAERPRFTPVPRPRLARARIERVLVVEDNADTAEMMRDALTLAGFRTRLASTAEEALEVLRSEPPEVVLCDIGLPGAMSGYDLARALATQPKRPLLLAVTGYGRPADREAAYAAGFDAHLTKPVDLDAIEDVLRELTGAARG